MRLKKEIGTKDHDQVLRIKIEVEGRDQEREIVYRDQDEG
jgi:hypothetical protein